MRWLVESASDYLLKLFVPFLDFFASHPAENPYAHFWQVGDIRAFPYPAVMLDIMSAPFLAAKTIAGGSPLSPFLTIALARLPLLAADTVIMAVLARWLRTRLRQALLYYWCSPVLFYITYMHGQLDVVPLALLFLSIHFLICERLMLTALCLGIALAAKTNLALVLPFFLLYVYRRDASIRGVLLLGGIILAAFLVPNLPYLADSSFFHMVLANPEQKKLALAAIPFAGSSSFYIILAVYLILFFGASRIVMQSRDLFLMFLGFSFGVIIFFIPPMQGWYYWIIPFFAYFFARAPEKIALFTILQATYFLFFALTPGSDYLQTGQLMFPHLASAPNLYHLFPQIGIDGDFAANVAFTLMQTALLLNCLWIYTKGVKGLQKRKLISYPFLLGIGGNSGSGKTSLANDMLSLFTPRFATVICGDDMHKWQRGHEKWSEMTHLDPRANELHHEIHALRRLRRRRTIQRRHYDHNTGQFTDEKTVKSAPLVIYEGLHSFYLEPAHQLFDLKVFVDPEQELWLQRKVTRDMGSRNYSREQVLEILEQRAEDSERYIVQQRKMADIVVSFRLAHPFSPTNAVPPSEKDVFLQMRFANKLFLEPLIEGLTTALGKDITHIYDVDGIQVVDIHHTVAQETLQWLGEKYISGFQDMGIHEPHWANGWNGIVQLFLAFSLFYEARLDHNE